MRLIVGAEPCTYQPNFNSTQKSAPKCKFGTEAKNTMQDKKNVPGPGAYELRTKVSPRNKVPLGHKYKNRNQDDIPGPGHYEPKIDFESNKINCFLMGKMGNDKKNKQNYNDYPSPDQYFQDPR